MSYIILRTTVVVLVSFISLSLKSNENPPPASPTPGVLNGSPNWKRSKNAVPFLPLHAKPTPKSPFESNILRILGNEIDYQCDYAPPQQPVKKFNSFTVQDRPGEQWITMRGKFGDSEEIKIEATMFDGFERVPKLGDDSSGVNVRLHISLLVDISKGEGGNELEFVCSAWPDSLEVEKVYVLRRDGMLARPYTGPNFRNLNAKIQEEFRQYLEQRGVNSELSVFLHDYMMNKDRIELINWLRNVKTIVEK